MKEIKATKQVMHEPDLKDILVELQRTNLTQSDTIKNLQNEVANLIRQNELLEVKSDEYVQLAQYDSLTGLYNRAGITDRLNWLLEQAQRNNQNLAVALLDLDHFKGINDTLGHHVGDLLLKTVAARIQKGARKVDTIGRLGGDEFVIIVTNPLNQNFTFDILQRIISGIAEPIELEKRCYEVTCSIGFSLYPQDGKNAQQLLQFADSAMYQAKKNGRANFQYYSAALQQQIQARIKMEFELKQALLKNEFVVYYQPQMDMRTGAIVGLEALIRWLHPKHGIVPPTDFIFLAEEIGLILPIGDWIFENVCQQIKQWQLEGLTVPRVAVNLSVKQLTQTVDIVENLQKKLTKAGITADCITLEITESLSLDAAQKYVALLQQLNDLGFQISIDDFGTGYSSLNYLKKFPIHEIKIDKSFVDEITSNPHDKAIATTIITVAHHLGFRVVAEGIESKAQLALLAKEGCDILQGYYFNHALPVNLCRQLLIDNIHLDLEGILPRDYQRTMLLVDDDANVLASLCRVFRKRDLVVLVAESGEKALEILALNEVGIILSDLSMPKMNGIDLLDTIHQMYPRVVRMILSGKSEFELACDAINRGAIHKFITKPWDEKLLCKEIDDAFVRFESR